MPRELRCTTPVRRSGLQRSRTCPAWARFPSRWPEAMSGTALQAAPIGVFDSGVGGLSVLRHIHALLPQETLLYFADSAFAPYGDKTEARVVACNPAPVAAIRALREAFPAMPIVGVEPGLNPGAAASRNGKVAVLATDGTLAGAKFQLLHQQLSLSSNAQFLLRGCTGLADQIEFGQRDSAATSAMLRKYILPLIDQGADTLVLGCTHYPLVRPAIEAILHEAGAAHVVLVDTGDAVARQLQRLLAGADALAPATASAAAVPAKVRAYTSGSAPALGASFVSLLGMTVPVEAVAVGVATA